MTTNNNEWKKEDYLENLKKVIEYGKLGFCPGCGITPEYFQFLLDKTIKEAFEAGRTVKNYKGEWQETYTDDHTSAKYPKLEDYLEAIKQ